MKKDTLLQIENILKSAKLVNITNILLEDGKVRGINDNKSAFILSEIELEDDLASIGVNRGDIFLSRLNLVKGVDDLKIKMKEKTMKSDNGDYDIVEQIEFKAKGVNVQYRCCNPSQIKAPKSIKDTDAYTIKYDESDIDLLIRATSCTDAENVKLSYDDENGLNFSLADLSGDVITIESDCTMSTDEKSPSFNFNYDLKSFTQLFKNCSTNEFVISTKGVMRIEVNNITFFMMPRA